MGVGKIKTSDLGQFVQECDRLGGPESEASVDYCKDFSIEYSTIVDDTLDPFSNEYFQQQLSLHFELHQSPVDQSKTEQAQIDVISYINSPNPIRYASANYFSEHGKTILTTMNLANLGNEPSILDMGAGWGFTSELFAYCGAKVTALDINPHFIKLIQERQKRFNFPIEAVLSSFDDYETTQKFDLIFFYESLHHSLKPWKTIKHISNYLRIDGKMAFAGEPINNLFWRHWGLRLDPLSVYCIHKYGWFENGWSEEFIKECFSRANLYLKLFPYIGLRGAHIGIATAENVSINSNAALEHFIELNNVYQDYHNVYQDYQRIINSKLYKFASSLRPLLHRLRNLRK